MTVASAVIDASVFVRSVVAPSSAARRWLEAVEEEELRAHAPDLVYVELASSLLKYVRVSALAANDALDALNAVVLLPLRVHRLGELAPGALSLALETGLSAYDSCYAVLARALEIPLVTADRRLAAAVENATLIV